MKTQIQKKAAPENSGKTAAKQQPARSVLQAYKNNTAQLASEEEEPAQMKSDTAQLAESEEEPVQMKAELPKLEVLEDEVCHEPFDTELPVQKKADDEEPVQMESENRTGMPDNLKAGVENLSGYSMDDVKVHYNSSQPSDLQAHAYAQGTDIHIAPGQEKHLPHEAWHVAQQKQGRVQPTMQMKGEVNVNDDAGLEKEADVMGEKAAALGITNNTSANAQSAGVAQKKTMQFHLPKAGDPDTKGYYNARADSQNVAYKSGRPVKFSTGFKQNMIKNEWRGQQAENGLYYMQTSGDSRQVVSESCIQIDHVYPWDNIEADLTSWNYLPSLEKKARNNKGLMTDSGKPSMYAARMYYHDVANLKPMTGSENASKGASDATDQVAIDKAIEIELNKATGKFHTMVGKCQEMVRDWGHDTGAVNDASGALGTVNGKVEEAKDFFEGY